MVIKVNETISRHLKTQRNMLEREMHIATYPDKMVSIVKEHHTIVEMDFRSDTIISLRSKVVSCSLTKREKIWK